MATTSTLWLLGGLVLVGSPVWAQATSFAPAATYPAGGAPRNLAVGDVNSDGKVDVLTANQNTSTASVLLGSGDGTFQAPTTYSTGTGSNPYDIAVADVNGDGKLDLLTANYGSNTAGVLLGNGNGTFQAATTFATGAANGRPVGIAVADVTGDGKPDLLTANSYGYSVSLFAGTGTGTFQAPVTYSFGLTSAPLDVVAADINGDGRPDVLAANAGSNTVSVLISTGGSASFQSGSFSVGPGASYVPYGLAVADINADGRPDVVTANQGNSTVSILLNTGSTFASAVSFQNSGSPVNVAVADLNADGRADLLTANPADPAVGVLLGNGNTSFQPLARYSTGGSDPYGIVLADINGDGRPDVLTSNYFSNSIGVLLNASAVLSSRATLPGATSTLHPNPAAEYATLTLGGLPASVAKVRATLLDITGRTVYQGTLTASQGRAYATVPAAGLAPGLYLVQLAPLDGLGALVGSLPTQRLSVR